MTVTNLKKMMKEHKLRKEDIASATGYSRTQIWRVLKYQSAFTDKLQKLILKEFSLIIDGKYQ